MFKLATKKIVGKRMLELRKSTGLSQRKFALEHDLWHSSVAEIESGLRYPTRILTIKLMKKMKVNANWLFIGEKPMIKRSRCIK